jgi:hypothetical protein
LVLSDIYFEFFDLSVRLNNIKPFSLSGAVLGNAWRGTLPPPKKEPS